MLFLLACAAFLRALWPAVNSPNSQPIDSLKSTAAMNNPDTVFADDKVLAQLLPKERSNDFFEALFGDAEEGSYDISLRYDGYDAASRSLRFYLDLHQRPGKCLVCNLTHGLPEVFSRHPIINIKGLAEDAAKLLGPEVESTGWKLGSTQQQEAARHCIPLTISISAAA